MKGNRRPEVDIDAQEWTRTTPVRRAYLKRLKADPFSSDKILSEKCLRGIDRLLTVTIRHIATIDGRTEQPACRHRHRHEEQETVELHAGISEHVWTVAILDSNQTDTDRRRRSSTLTTTGPVGGGSVNWTASHFPAPKHQADCGARH
jgi:hypothetical protein